MIYFTEFQTIVDAVLENTFHTFITNGFGDEPDRYNFLQMKDQGDTKQNFGIYYQHPNKQDKYDYYVLWGLTAFEKNEPGPLALNHSVFLTVDIIDKQRSNGQFFDGEDKTPYISEIVSCLDQPTLWQQTIDLLTDKKNDHANPKLKYDFQVPKITGFHLGSSRVEDNWKDTISFSLDFNYLGRVQENN